MISVTVNNRRAVAVPLTDVTTGATGIPVSFRFSSDWDGLSKVAVFRTDSEDPVEMAILQNQTTVPYEVLTTAYDILWIGVYGENAGGTIIIPTVWANAGAIQPGTESESFDPAEPTPSWAAQVQAAAEEALTIAGEIQTKADNGDFDGADGADGQDGVSPTASVSVISGGHRVTFEYGDGQSVFFDVLDGAAGIQGPQGERGPKGDQGAQGPRGYAGTNGATFMPSVDEYGVISWTNDGGLENPADMNIMGPAGEKGEKGDQGDAFTYDDFTEEQLEALTGPPGADGAPGVNGQDGRDGTDGVTFTPAVNAAGDISWTNDGARANPVTVNIKGPQGPKGDKGVSPTITVTEITGGHSVTITDADHPSGQTFNVTDGEDGQDGQDGVTPAFSIGTVTTGAAGSSASATITGTDAAPVLNLTIPQGLKGDTGNGDMIADDFSTSKSYAAGEYAIYNGSLYRFTAAHAAGAWVGTDVIEVPLANDVRDLKGAFSLFDDIPGSTQTVNFGSDGKPSSIVYTVGGVAARTDTFTWGDNTVTETRTLADGRHITFTTNLTTLVTTISDIEEAS